MQQVILFQVSYLIVMVMLKRTSDPVHLQHAQCCLGTGVRPADSFCFKNCPQLTFGDLRHILINYGGLEIVLSHVDASHH